MNDVLREVFERAQQQPESVQRHIAELVRRELERTRRQAAPSVEAPDNYAGAWNDLPEEDELEALDRLRHESSPTPPMQAQLDWLKDA